MRNYEYLFFIPCFLQTVLTVERISISLLAFSYTAFPSQPTYNFVTSREPVIDTTRLVSSLCALQLSTSIPFHSRINRHALISLLASSFQPSYDFHLPKEPPQKFHLMSCSLQSITSIHLPQSFPRKNSPLLAHTASSCLLPTKADLGVG